MQTLENIKQTLEKVTGLPVAYHHYEATHAFPYIVYEVTEQANLFADGVVYCETASIQVDLYTKTKDPRLERKVKEALQSLDVAWTSRSTAVTQEDCYATSFYFDITYID